MALDYFLNVAVGGLLTGLVYALMALGLSVIFGVVRVVNFAHGEMMTLAMYAAVMVFASFKLDPFLALLPIMGAFFVLGYWLQKKIISPFITRPEHAQFLLLVALSLVLANLQLALFGPNARNVLVSYGYDSYQIGFLIIDKVKVFGAVAALLIGAGLLLFFRFAHFGKMIRASADNYRGAEVVGLNIRKIYAVTFGLGAACVGAAGCILSLLIDVTPVLGPGYTLLAFVIVIVGGLGSMAGALLGGVLIGVSESLAGALVSPSAKSMVTFALLVVVLLVRPQGLLGRRP